MSVVISADATDAFSHLLMVGLASILEDANPDRVCLFRWLDDLQAFEIKTNDDLDIDQISKVVSEHAKRWSQSLPLTSQDDYTVSNESDKPSGAFHATMSPRLSNLGVPYGWEKLQRNREAAVDAMETLAITVTSAHWGSLHTGQVSKLIIVYVLISGLLVGKW